MQGQPSTHHTQHHTSWPGTACRPGCRGCTGKRGCPRTPGRCSSSWHPAPLVAHPWLQERHGWVWGGHHGQLCSHLVPFWGWDPWQGDPGCPSASVGPGAGAHSQICFSSSVCVLCQSQGTHRAQPGLEVALGVWGSLHLPEEHWGLFLSLQAFLKVPKPPPCVSFLPFLLGVLVS